jgi:hypothetical protein
MGLNELEIETTTWLRKLDGMQYENTDMKNRLADAVKQTISAAELDEAEQFQSRFLNKDAVISFMRVDIKEQAHKLKTGSNNTFDMLTRQNKLRMDMEKMEAEFDNMRTMFSGYLLHLA